MLNEQPLEIRGAKIPLFALRGAYDDLLGGTLDRSLFTPWLEVIQQIRDSGANNVTLIVSAGVMRKATDSAFDPTLNYNPDMKAIRQLISLIQAHGMGVNLDLFPHVADVISGDASKAGNDRPYPTNQDEWFQNFSTSVLEWARFAEEVGATGLIPFSDVTQHLFLDPKLTDDWLGLIDQIRQNFSGVLTTNWWTPGYGDSITAIPGSIIQKLDYLGVGFFPNLSTDSNASLQDLVGAYHRDPQGHDLLVFLQNLYTTYKKPIWITDKAFHSFDGAGLDESRIFNNSIPLVQDLEEQARLYDSFLTAVLQEGGNWLKGVSFQSFNNIDDSASLVARFVNGPLSESPQGKPALQVMSDWFNGLRQGPGLSLTGSDRGEEIFGGYLHDRLDGGIGNDSLIGAEGDDVLIGGPEKSTLIENYAVEISLRGVPVLGISPAVQVQTAAGQALLNASVSGVFKVGKSSAEQVGESTLLRFNIADASGFTLFMTNWAFVDFSDTGNRFVHIESAKVNGIDLDLSQFMTYQPPTPHLAKVGSVDSVHGGKFLFNTAAAPIKPEFITSTDNDAIYGGTGQDSLSGGFGNDWLDGGKGVDAAIYAGRKVDYQVMRVTGGFEVRGILDQGKDALIDVERVRFTDTSLALDLSGHAGIAAKTLGAVFGKDAVNNQSFVGIGLHFLDELSYSYPSLMQLAINARLGAKPSHDQVVDLLYTNVVGSAPDAATRKSFTDLLDNGTFTAGSLGVLAADTELNKTNINLVGLAQSGLEYLPFSV